MSAQAAQEPSMEDILASIRKIISEDGDSQSPENGAAAGVPVANDVNNLPPSETPAQTPELVERRNSFEASAASMGQPIAAAPSDTIPGETAPQGAVTNTSKLEGSYKPIESSSMPGFVERKPQASIPPVATAQGAKSDTPLHPAIANAKEFVLRTEATTTNGAQQVEKPLFQNSDALPLPASSTPLVSPDDSERREEEERRNHPLRRATERESEELSHALMSSDTNEAVGSAFQQLKQSATQNLDENVEALLRPMLREWLDDNLPSMVERLVRDEIERVSRGD